MSATNIASGQPAVSVSLLIEISLLNQVFPGSDAGGAAAVFYEKCRMMEA